MAGPAREAFNRQLLDIIHSMEEEQGLVDHRFAMAHSMKETNGPFFFAALLPTFCRDSTATLRELTVALGQPVLNYHELDELCIKIKGSASCIGACRMALACCELRRAVENRSSKESCVTALNAMKQEFLLLQEKMDTLVQLERRIVSHETDGP
ncbi:hypothetical protein CRYUN_Cryun01aG0072800 [Craigia yunnanensis]